MTNHSQMSRGTKTVPALVLHSCECWLLLLINGVSCVGCWASSSGEMKWRIMRCSSWHVLCAWSVGGFFCWLKTRRTWQQLTGSNWLSLQVWRRIIPIFTTRRYASAVFAVTLYLSVRPSVRLSVTSRYCITTAKRIIMQIKCAVSFVENSGVFGRRLAIKTARRTFNSDKMRRIYTELYFGVKEFFCNTMYAKSANRNG